ncbi:MAG: DUF3987 domain-containing protein, partial [Thermomicrobiales bacterium]|nr:DUF3987 domain-containing protein [Thermomicrobiales bacterium]
NVIPIARFQHLEDAGSDVALLEKLEANPNTLLVLRELASAIAKMRSKGREALFDLMLTLWDANPKYQNTTIANPIEVYNPTFSLLAGIQPERLRAAMNDQVLSSGFMNRPLIIPGDGVAPISNPPSVNTEKTKALLKELLWRFDDLAAYGGNQPVELPMSADSAERWDAYYQQQWWAAKRNPELAETASRNPDLVRKIALHYAITEMGRTLPERLEWRHIEAGMALVEWKSRAVAKLIGEWGGTDETRIEERIKKTLARRGAMSVRLLKQHTYLKGVPSSIWNRAFESLRKSGEVVETATAGVFEIAGEKEAA